MSKKSIFSFAIGGDGQIYEGRGFNVVGAHAPKYNDKSVGICLIGDWSSRSLKNNNSYNVHRNKNHFILDDLPSPKMFEAVQELISQGLSINAIRSNYTLLGHRQTRYTECPGDRLFAEISTWPHFSAEPRNRV